MSAPHLGVPKGKMPAVVTWLDMYAPAAARPVPQHPEFSIRRVDRPGVDWYRDLYRAIGEPWLWFSRLRMADNELERILGDERVEVWTLVDDGQDKGLCELDRRMSNEIELACFGLTEELIGQGAGRLLMDHAIKRAWSFSPARFWVHTCTLDHPGALAFYLRSGFRAYKRTVEMEDDPRLTGLYPETTKTDVPVLSGLPPK